MATEEIVPTSEVEKVKDTPVEDTPKETEKTYTQAEHDRSISKSVEAAIAKREAKLEKEIAERIENAKNEAAEYAKLTQKEKTDADFQKRMEQLEKRENEINSRELLSQIQSDLKENNLPLSFADSLLNLKDNAKIKDRISQIKKDYDDAINQGIKESLRQKTPSVSTSDGKELDPFEAKLKKYRTQ